MALRRLMLVLIIGGPIMVVITFYKIMRRCYLIEFINLITIMTIVTMIST